MTCKTIFDAVRSGVGDDGGWGYCPTPEWNSDTVHFHIFLQIKSDIFARC